MSLWVPQSDNIKPIEQESRADAISREGVLAEIHNWSKDEFLRVTNSFDYLYKRINSLPPVTPPEKIGQWIYIGNKDINQSVKIVECNVCHKRNMGSSKYCPNCGIKMKEVEE